jgi:hypothetical protein
VASILTVLAEAGFDEAKLLILLKKLIWDPGGAGGTQDTTFIGRVFCAVLVSLSLTIKVIGYVLGVEGAVPVS